VPVALGTGLIGGLSMIINKAIGFLKLRKLQKSYPGIREGKGKDDWMFRKMPEEVFEEHIRKKEEEKKTGWEKLKKRLLSKFESIRFGRNFPIVFFLQ
jgi:hypothetical protein